MSIILGRGPRTDDELYELVKALWGITIPRHKVCRDHDAPFDAFADGLLPPALLDPDPRLPRSERQVPADVHPGADRGAACWART